MRQHEVPIYIHLIHGTWPRGLGAYVRRLAVLLGPRVLPGRLQKWFDSSESEDDNRDKVWFDEGSNFRTKVLARLSHEARERVRFEVHEWSGSNSMRARKAAAEHVREKVKSISKTIDARHLAIAHSHGGNVAVTAWDAFDGILTMATPFLTTPRAERLRTKWIVNVPLLAPAMLLSLSTLWMWKLGVMGGLLWSSLWPLLLCGTGLAWIAYTQWPARRALCRALALATGLTAVAASAHASAAEAVTRPWLPLLIFLTTITSFCSSVERSRAANGGTRVFVDTLLLVALLSATAIAAVFLFLATRTLGTTTLFLGLLFAVALGVLIFKWQTRAVNEWLGSHQHVGITVPIPSKSMQLLALRCPTDEASVSISATQALWGLGVGLALWAPVLLVVTLAGGFVASVAQATSSPAGWSIRPVLEWGGSAVAVILWTVLGVTAGILVLGCILAAAFGPEVLAFFGWARVDAEPLPWVKHPDTCRVEVYWPPESGSQKESNTDATWLERLFSSRRHSVIYNLDEVHQRVAKWIEDVAERSHTGSVLRGSIDETTSPHLDWVFLPDRLLMTRLGEGYTLEDDADGLRPLKPEDAHVLLKNVRITLKQCAALIDNYLAARAEKIEHGFLYWEWHGDPGQVLGHCFRKLPLQRRAPSRVASEAQAPTNAGLDTARQRAESVEADRSHSSAAVRDQKDGHQGQ